MKALIITHKYPLPEISGDRIRTMNFTRYFRKFGEVDLMYFHGADEEVVTGSPFNKAICVDKYEVDTYKNSVYELYEKLKYSKPWVVAGFTRACINRVVNIIEHEKYDWILCRYSHHAFPLFFLPDIYNNRIVIDLDDLMTKDLYTSVYGSSSGIMGMKSFVDFKLYQRYQIRCSALGKTLVCSETDRASLGKHVKSEKLHVVPNIAPDFKEHDEYDKNGHGNIGKLLFVGNLIYKPNVNGLIWFIREIFDRLTTMSDEIRLTVVGKDADPYLKAMCNGHERVDLIENAPDISPYYNKCGVVIVPLLTGGGTRIKILEAGRAMRPIITTEIGAYGLNLTDYEKVLFMNDYDSFVERYNWLKDSRNYLEVTKNMNIYVNENYSIAAFEKSMDSVLSEGRDFASNPQKHSNGIPIRSSF